MTKKLTTKSKGDGYAEWTCCFIGEIQDSSSFFKYSTRHPHLQDCTKGGE